MTRTIRLPALARIACVVGALAACTLAWPIAWDAYRASRLVDAAQGELAWGRLEASRERLERASRIAPGNADLLATLAEVQASIARLRGDEPARARAVASLESATRLHPLDAGLHASLGSIHLSFGSLDAAADAFDRALELDPHNQLFLASLAQVREAQERFEDAASLYRRAMSIQPSKELETRLERVERP